MDGRCVTVVELGLRRVNCPGTDVDLMVTRDEFDDFPKIERQ
jgi:hypothetical protein